MKRLQERTRKCKESKGTAKGYGKDFKGGKSKGAKGFKGKGDSGKGKGMQCYRCGGHGHRERQRDCSVNSSRHPTWDYTGDLKL